MTSYNPIISTLTTNHSTISFINPTGSSGWISRKGSTWSIQDCSGFSITSSSDGTIHIHFEGGDSPTHRFTAGKDYRTRSNGTFKFTHPNEDNLAWVEVRRNGLMRYQDSRGNFTVVFPSGKVRFVDIYVERNDTDDAPDEEKEIESENEASGTESVFMPWLNLGVFIPSKRNSTSEEDQNTVKDNRQSVPWIFGKLKNILTLTKSLSIALKK